MFIIATINGKKEIVGSANPVFNDSHINTRTSLNVRSPDEKGKLSKDRRHKNVLIEDVTDNHVYVTYI